MDHPLVSEISLIWLFIGWLLGAASSVIILCIAGVYFDSENGGEMKGPKHGND